MTRTLLLTLIAVAPARADVYSKPHPARISAFEVDAPFTVVATKAVPQCTPEVLDDIRARYLGAEVTGITLVDGEASQIDLASDNYRRMSRPLGSGGFVDRDDVSFYAAIDGARFTFAIIVRGPGGTVACATKLTAHAHPKKL